MKIEEHVDLAPLSTMQVGGRARFLATVETVADLKESLGLARSRQLAVVILGGGSNIVFDSQGFPGLVLRLAHQGYSMSSQNHQIVAGAAVPMEELVTQTTEKGWQGLEWAGGLPGTLGGAIRGNAGAFGGEIQATVRAVRSVNPLTFAVKDWTVDDCQFGYRTSIFKHNQEIIWEVRLVFQAGQRDELTRVREEKIAYRARHHPHAPSVGSIFQNLFVRDLPADFFDRFPQLRAKMRGDKIGAGALLDTLTMRGRKCGGAMISHEHANIIVNTGDARSTEIRELAALMKQAVRDQYRVILKEEPEFRSS